MSVNSIVNAKLQKAIENNDYSGLTTAEEDELIARFPNQFSRDEPIYLNGKRVYDGLLDADENCNHLVKTRMSGVGCVKCHGWYCA